MWEMIFFNNHGEKDAGRLGPDLLLFFRKALYKVRASCQHLKPKLVFIYFGTPQPEPAIKKNCITFNTVDPDDPEICSIFIFCKRIWEWLLHQILCTIFQEKYFSCFNPLTDQILLSSSRLEILGNMCNVISFYPLCDVINFEMKSAL